MATSSDDNITEIGQAYHAVYHNVQVRRAYGYGVITGADVTPGSSGLSIDVDGGDVLRAGEVESFSADTLTLTAADGSDPRKDVVVWDGSSLTTIDGTPAPIHGDQPSATRFDTYQPSPPDTQGQDVVVLAEVWVAAGAGSVSSDDINELATSPAANFSRLGLPDDRKLTLGDDDDFSLRYDAATNQMVVEDEGTGNTFEYGSDGSFTIDGDLTIGGAFDPGTITPDTVTVGSSLELPTYADNANAVAEDAEVWFNDGSGPQAAGIYYYDGGVVGPLATGAGSSPGSLSGLTIDTDKDWAGYVIDGMGHDGVKVPQATTKNVTNEQSGTLPDSWTGDTDNYSVVTSPSGSGYAFQASTPSSSQFRTLTRFGGVIPEPGDTTTLQLYLTDTSDIIYAFILEDSTNGVEVRANARDDELEIRDEKAPISSSEPADVSGNLNKWLDLEITVFKDPVGVSATLSADGSELATVELDPLTSEYPVTGIGLGVFNSDTPPTVYWRNWTTQRRSVEYLTSTRSGPTELGNEVTPSGGIHTGPHEAELDGSTPHAHYRTDSSLSGGADVSVVDDYAGADMGVRGQADGDGLGYGWRRNLAAKLNANLSIQYRNLSDTPSLVGVSNGGSYTTELFGHPRKIRVSHDGSAEAEGGVYAPVIISQDAFESGFRFTFHDVTLPDKNDNQCYVSIADIQPDVNGQMNNTATDGVIQELQFGNFDTVQSGSSSRQDIGGDIEGDITFEVFGGSASVMVDGVIQATNDTNVPTSADMFPSIQVTDQSGTAPETVEVSGFTLEVLK